MAEDNPLCCPVCRAAFGGQTQCPGCGADLSRLMWVAARAAQLRQQARAALNQGKYQQASHLSGQALRLHATDRGRRLLEVSRVLAAVRVGPPA